MNRKEFLQRKFWKNIKNNYNKNTLYNNLKIMELDVLKTQIAGRWNQLTGKIKEEYYDLTGDELAETEAKIEKIAGMLQAKYPEKFTTLEKAMEHAKTLSEELLKKMD